MALGRFRACVELYFARWVSAVSVQISNVYPSLSADHRVWQVLRWYECVL